jgi:hypothetical protein
MKKMELTGMRFGRLVVTAPADTDGWRSRWHCRCDCGGERVVLGQCLVQGQTKSCGCLRAETNPANGRRFRGHDAATLARCGDGSRRAAEAARDLQAATFAWHCLPGSGI